MEWGCASSESSEGGDEKHFLGFSVSGACPPQTCSGEQRSSHLGEPEEAREGGKESEDPSTSARRLPHTSPQSPFSWTVLSPHAEASSFSLYPSTEGLCEGVCVRVLEALPRTHLVVDIGLTVVTPGG